MHIPQRAIDDMKAVEGWEKFFRDDGTSLTPNLEWFWYTEYMEARKKGLQKVIGYDLLKEDDTVEEAVRYDHDVWRIAGVPTPVELALLKEESTGAVEQAFPYLMFGDYEDALLWRLRHF